MKEIVVLSNGKRVANFSSPHEFKFVDGSILDPVPPSEAERLKVTFIENDLGNGDIELDFDLSYHVRDEIKLWMELYSQKKVNVVFCPLPMISAIRKLDLLDLKESPFRAIRVEDRISKLISIDKQCL